ncbi:SOS response-associated peptidase [Sphingomonas sp. HF-S4]|uniref:Abasic site processing protein n=1 Tax=Sphingomonas agrestis TaxID=3080540 RepID=A0ABU3Y354_9SPHN|nr:SOS response-associated peptidase [Sphingomonas sp. HF-S4]MDV3455809.1 SOS response-associated peptidase [Sphingomonas sp. HF-S4]
MCNDYRLEVGIASILEDFADLEIAVDAPEGTPNVAARSDILITDIAPIVRSAEGGGGELVNRRWSWPGQQGKPVYNFRSEGREFTSRRCLILADGFYEFTRPEDPKQKRQDKWLFTLRDHRWLCIAGIWRAHPQVGEAFTMLTMAPGEDVAPYHSRQIVTLPRDRWADWLDASVPAREIVQPLPKGSLDVVRVYPRASAQPALL